MFCYNCGKEIRDDANYCAFCGTRVSKDVNEEEKLNDVKEIKEKQQVDQSEEGSNKYIEESNSILMENKERVTLRPKYSQSKARKIIQSAVFLAVMIVCLCMVFAPIYKIECKYDTADMSIDNDLEIDSIKVLTLYFDSFVDNTEKEQQQDDVYKDFVDQTAELSKYILRGDEESAEDVLVLSSYTSMRLYMRSSEFSATVAQHIGAISLMLYILTSIVGVFVALIWLIRAIDEKNVDKNNKNTIGIAKILFVLGLTVVINKGACGVFAYNLQAGYGLIVAIILIAVLGIAKFIEGVVVDKIRINRKTLILKAITAVMLIVAIGCMSGGFVSFTFKSIAKDATMNTGFGVFNYFDESMVEYYEANNYPKGAELILEDISSMYTRRDVQEGEAFGMNNYLVYRIIGEYSIMNDVHWFSLISIISIAATTLLGLVLICSIFSLGENKKSISVTIAKSISVILSFVALVGTIAFVLLMQYYIGDNGLRGDYAIAVGGAVIAAIFFVLTGAFLPYNTKEKNV
ncbi:MAG: zinc ribbon domain-containing protein [Christensenellales bacterium]